MIGFVSDFIVHTAYTANACALTSVLPSPSLIDMIYCTAETKATSSSVQDVGVDFYIDMGFTFPYHCETFSK
jgi:hypothetical protein